MEPRFIKQWMEGLDPARVFVFDVETNGFLDELDTIHVVSVRSLDGTRVGVANINNPRELQRLLYQLKDAAALEGWHLAGHNVINFDIPAIQKVYPWFRIPRHRVIDTLTLSYLFFPDIKHGDLRRVKKGQMPAKMAGRHSLESWGYRLGEKKVGVDITDWSQWTQEMEDRCHQDTLVNVRMLEKFWPRISAYGQAPAIEHAVQWYVAKQERTGIHFDEKGAWELAEKLAKERAAVEAELAKVPQFAPFFLPKEVAIPRRSMRVQVEELGPDPKRPGYFKTMDTTADVPITKVELVHFKPTSHAHIAYVLQRRFGWEPVEFTEETDRFGQPLPKLDEAIIAGLTFPGVELLQKHFVLTKRLGQLVEGSKAWLNVVKGGKIHGRVIACGTVTGRASHRDPNLSQVPAPYSPYGPECRALFKPRPGRVMVGCDADGLEARDMAGYLVPFDGGAFMRALLEGKKEEGTDIHSMNARALGLDPKQYYPELRGTGRDVAKTWFYAFIYGAGDEKLGIILTGRRGSTARRVGAERKKLFLKNSPGLAKLAARIRERVKERGYLLGLDGRHLRVRSLHSALNTLFQSAGAVQMKVAMILMQEAFEDAGLDGCLEMILFVHDEFDFECDPGLEQQVGQIAAEAIAGAGRYLKFQCPLVGNFKVGANWQEIH